MATAIKIPAVGTTVNEITLLKWRKSVGDDVKRGDILCEIETDKATMELESVAEGILLKQMVSAEMQVAEGSILAWIGQVGEEIPDESAAEQIREKKPVNAIEPPALSPRIDLSEKENISPLIRNLAKKLGVDLDKITGTGPGGKIIREDILNAQSEK
jgi:pyruvate dehydrogenase E2 component (dihydrolipoamide acetyltransferase)